MERWVSFCIVELPSYHMLNESDGKLVPFYKTAIPQFNEVVANNIWIICVLLSGKPEI